jgi:hypothetical protein
MAVLSRCNRRCRYRCRTNPAESGIHTRQHLTHTSLQRALHRAAAAATTFSIAVNIHHSALRATRASNNSYLHLRTFLIANYILPCRGRRHPCGQS